MKNIILSTLALILSNTIAMGQGINFRDITLEESVKQSAAENKMVFIDCYTTWCGPCKHMANNVFTLKRAGDYFNSDYVSIKIDIENGDGPAIARKYEVRAVPTFVVLDSTGKLQAKVVGGSEIEEFIARLEKELDPETQKKRIRYELEYVNGTIGTEDLREYWQQVSQDAGATQIKKEEIGQTLLSRLSIEEKFSDENFQLLRSLSNTPTSMGLRLILENRNEAEKGLGTDRVNDMIYWAYYGEMRSYTTGTITETMVKRLPVLLAEVQQLIHPRKNEILDMVEVAEVRVKNDFDLYLNYLLENCHKISDVNKTSMVASLPRTGPVEKTREQYIQMADVIRAIKESLAGEATTAHKLMDIYTYLYRSSGTKGVYWNDLKSLEDIEQKTTLLYSGLTQRNIFITCYTESCESFKQMERNVFSQEEVGDYMNSKFLSVKMDMEKEGGPEIAQKFEVTSYPTFLIITADGVLRHRFSGIYSPKELIEKLEEALNTIPK